MILLDCEVIGPIARTVADARALFHALAGLPTTPPSPALPPLRILYARHFGGSPVDAEIAASVEQAAKHLAALGHIIEDGSAPFDIDALNRAWPVISQVGLAWLLKDHARRLHKISPPMQDMARAGHALPATDYYAAVEVVLALRQRLAEFFVRTDLILTPTIAALSWPAAEPFPPTIAGQSVGPRGHAVFTAFANMAGCPAISIPCAPSKSGLPIGFHLVGPVGHDEMVLAAAAQYEALHADRRMPFPSV